MNFDDIKSKMDTDSSSINLPDEVASQKESQLPVARIRKKMNSEIKGQLLIMVVFILAPLIGEMYPLPRTIYILFAGLIILITLGYLVKMKMFLKQTKSLDTQAQSALYTFIYEFKLTMEVYKVAVISSSLLIPFPLLAFTLGQVVDGNEELFTQWFLMQVPVSYLVIFFVGYLLFAAFVYFITVKWMKLIYGKQLNELEEVLGDLR
ncbi:MAG: hypothetical protein AB8B73_02495 [Ekhidna sp.]